MDQGCGYRPTIALSMPYGTEREHEAVRAAVRKFLHRDDLAVNFDYHHGDHELPGNPYKWVIGIADDCCEIDRSCELSTVAVYFALGNRFSVRITDPSGTDEFMLTRFY